MPNPLTAHFWHTLLGESMPQHKNGRTSSTGLKPVAPVRQNLVARISARTYRNDVGIVCLGGVESRRIAFNSEHFFT